jgi:hypothetical protein
MPATRKRLDPYAKKERNVNASDPSREFHAMLNDGFVAFPPI